MLMAADEQKVTLLCLLDMSAAFDCVDHIILLQRLQVAVGIGDTALGWIRSFLSGRTQRCRTICYVSGAVRRSTGHGSWITAVMASLFDIIAQHRINTHQHADDLQLYLCMPLAEASIATDRLNACLVGVKAWLKASQLRLNLSKTLVMWLGSAQQLAKVRLDEVPVL